MARIQGIPCKLTVSDATAARLKIVVSPVRVRVSPSRLSCKYAAFAALCGAREKAENGRWPFPGSATDGQHTRLARACTSPGVHDAFRVRTLPRWEDRNAGLTDNERSDESGRALAGLVCVGQIDAARAVVAPGAVNC
jgi:hypothetical protein